MALMFYSVDRHRKQVEQQYISDVLQTIDEWHDRFNSTEEENRLYRVGLFAELSDSKAEFISGDYENEEIVDSYAFVKNQMRDWFYDEYNEKINNVTTVADINSNERHQYILDINMEIDDLYDSFDITESNGAGRADRVILFRKLSENRTTFTDSSFVSDKLDNTYAYINTLHRVRALIISDGVLADTARQQVLFDMIDSLVAAYSEDLSTEDSEDVLVKFDFVIDTTREWFLNHYVGLIGTASELERDDENDKNTISKQIEDLESVKFFIEADKVINGATALSLTTLVDELIVEYEEELAEIIERERLEAERLAREAAARARRQQQNNNRTNTTGGTQNTSNTSNTGDSSTTTTSGRYPQISSRCRDMLARLVRLEGRQEPANGKQAIAEVVLNRMVSSRWNHVSTVEEVIFDKKWGVQFTVSGMIWGDRATPTSADFTAVDNALNGPNILSMSYLYFNSSPVTQTDVVWIGSHAFSK
jgi:spore germination cell wall hydrolase CwlJ-like protein